MAHLQADTPGLERGSTIAKPSNPLQLIADVTASKQLEASDEHWVPSKHEKAIIYTLALLNLIIALDATIIVTSLTVTTPLLVTFPYQRNSLTCST